MSHSTYPAIAIITTIYCVNCQRKTKLTQMCLFFSCASSSFYGPLYVPFSGIGKLPLSTMPVLSQTVPSMIYIRTVHQLNILYFVSTAEAHLLCVSSSSVWTYRSVGYLNLKVFLSFPFCPSITIIIPWMVFLQATGHSITWS